MTKRLEITGPAALDLTDVDTDRLRTMVADLDAARELGIEAAGIEAQHGPNPYSDYLRKHKRRPSRVVGQFDYFWHGKLA